MRTKNTSVLKFMLVATMWSSIGVSSMISSAALAQAKPTPAPAAGKDDKVDISDLENKYWAPKDTDFSVVQNRTYSKAGSFVISPEWGKQVNDSYSEGTVYGLTANYFWSERFGVQATYISADMENNNATNDLAVYGSGVQPDHGKLRQHYSLGVNVVPFYAKMSFWGKKIIYFDMAFTPHIGMTKYTQMIESGNKTKSSLTYGIDVTQYFFFSKWFAVRVDLKNQWYSQEVVKFRSSGGIGIGQKVTDKMIHDTLFLIGPAFYW